MSVPAVVSARINQERGLPPRFRSRCHHGGRREALRLACPQGPHRGDRRHRPGQDRLLPLAERQRDRRHLPRLRRQRQHRHCRQGQYRQQDRGQGPYRPGRHCRGPGRPGRRGGLGGCGEGRSGQRRRSSALHQAHRDPEPDDEHGRGGQRHPDTGRGQGHLVHDLRACQRHGDTQGHQAAGDRRRRGRGHDHALDLLGHRHRQRRSAVPAHQRPHRRDPDARGGPGPLPVQQPQGRNQVHQLDDHRRGRLDDDHLR